MGTEKRKGKQDDSEVANAAAENTVPETSSTPRADLWTYAGVISREGYNLLSSELNKRNSTGVKSPHGVLALITSGGDPAAAYRMARALGHHYEKVSMLIPGYCKSAGTLMCIGCDDLIVGDRGELGPLDIQLSKPDEIAGQVSGLDIIQSMSTLEVGMLKAFKRYLLEMRLGGGLSTRMSAELATKLSIGLMAPIAGQIDPNRLGEHGRAQMIGLAYGERLNKMHKSLKPNALKRLLNEYPYHGFVIDRKECTELFSSVRAPSTVDEKRWYELCRYCIDTGVFDAAADAAMVLDLSRLESIMYPPQDEASLPDEHDAPNNSEHPHENLQ